MPTQDIIRCAGAGCMLRKRVRTELWPAPSMALCAGADCFMCSWLRAECCPLPGCVRESVVGMGGAQGLSTSYRHYHNPRGAIRQQLAHHIRRWPPHRERECGPSHSADRQSFHTDLIRIATRAGYFTLGRGLAPRHWDPPGSPSRSGCYPRRPGLMIKKQIRTFKAR